MNSEIITSLHNSYIKTVSSLKQKKYRDKLGLFMVEGIRLVEEAAAAEWEIEACLYTAKAAGHDRIKAVLKKLEQTGCRMLSVTDAVYEKISDTEQPQGIMLIVKKQTPALSAVLENVSRPLIVVLDGLQDPGNVGTVIRTADAAGCTAVVLTAGTADVFAGKTVRATMGSLFHLPVIADVTVGELVEVLRSYNITLAITALDAAQVYYNVDFTQPVAIVFGNEGNGVSQEICHASRARLIVPMYGKTESLNVSASAAIILYEAVRQRHSTL